MFGDGGNHYNPDEPRDDRGRWTSGGSGDAPLFGFSTARALSKLGTLAARAVDNARGATFLARLPVIPRPGTKDSAESGTLPGLGHYLWERKYRSLELTGWDGQWLTAYQGAKKTFYVAHDDDEHPIGRVLGTSLVIDPERLASVRSLRDQARSTGEGDTDDDEDEDEDEDEDDEGDDEDDEDSDGSLAADRKRIGGGWRHAPLVTRAAASTPLFGFSSEQSLAKLGDWAAMAIGQAGDRAAFVADLPVLPWPKQPVGTGSLAGLGTYRWNRSFGVLILTLADGREIVACHGANDRFYVLYNHEYRPIGQILGGRSLVLDPDRLRKAVAALGGNAEPPTGSLFDRVLGAVAEALNPIGTAEARSEAAADLAAVDPMTRGSGFPPLRPPG
jgi:hypothetical protein